MQTVETFKIFNCKQWENCHNWFTTLYLQIYSDGDNFFLFEFWRAEKIILILSLRTFFRTISGQLIFSECLRVVFWLFGIWKKYELWKEFDSLPGDKFVFVSEINLGIMLFSGCLEGIVRVISNDPLWKDFNTWFTRTTTCLNALSDQV